LVCLFSDLTCEWSSNPIRANTIKLRKEACLLAGITERQWQHLKKKFAVQASKYYNKDVANTISMIETICECRLIYSGTSMDMFILKNHYGYRGK
jgi:hypothetical protein